MTPYAGTWPLLRLALRRDRVLIPLWAAVLAVSTAGSVQATADLYPDRDGRAQAADLINDSPATLFMYGPIEDPESLGALGTFKMLAMGALFVSLLGMFVVRRHTRTDEEAGRLELVSAGVVGKRAALTAAVVAGLVAVVTTCLVTAFANAAVGLPLESSLAFGAAWGASGVFFVALTALVAQLTESARACAGIVAATLGASYVLRGVADTLDGAWRAFDWISPLGWTVQLRPYAGDRWWVLLVPAVLAPLVLTAAYRMQDRRDLGAGLIATRPGPAHAAAWLGTPLGLAWRQQRGLLLGWLVGMMALGVVFGSLVSSVADFLSPQMLDFFEKLGGVGALEDVFLSAELGILAIAISGYAIATLHRMSSEEAEGRTELVLSTAVPRHRWFLSHAIVALAGTVVLELGLSLGAGLTLGMIQGDVADGVGRLVPAALANLPAIWVLAGVTSLFYGLARRLATAAWGVLVGCLLLGQIGELLGLSPAVLNLSPYTHTPKAPAEAITATPVTTMVLVAGVLLVAGLVAFRRRDIAGR